MGHPIYLTDKQYEVISKKWEKVKTCFKSDVTLNWYCGQIIYEQINKDYQIRINSLCSFLNISSASSKVFASFNSESYNGFS